MQIVQQVREVCLKIFPFTMRVLQILILALLSAMVITLETSELETIKGNGEFAQNMYRIISRDQGNIVFSPFSAHACLSMLYQGVSGPLLQECADVLKVQDPLRAAEGYKSIMDTLNSSENATLLIANKAYIDSSLQFLETFQTTVQDKFHSEVESINFGDADKAAATINKWVKDKTQGKIEELLKPDDLGGEITTLVNTLYFKSNWANQFEKRYTSKKPFYIDNDNQINVDTMHKNAEYPFKESEQLNAKILEMPYENNQFSLVVILPNERDGIEDLEAKVLESDISDIIRDLKEEYVSLALPKFKFGKSIQLKQVLSEMGLKGIFSSSPYMDGIVPLSDLYVSKVIQKVVIEVDEKGSEAAAATAIVFESISFHVPPRITFTADHPFLFFLTHKHLEVPDSRNILFYGRVERPGLE